MAKLQKIEESFEINCSAEKIYEMVSEKQNHIAKVSSHIVRGAKVHQHGWFAVGSTRKWDFNYGGKSTYIVDKIEEIDENNFIINRSVIEGDIMKHYKTMKVKFQTIPKGNNSCIVKYGLEYEKINETSPEPTEFHNFGVTLFKHLGDHISSTY